MLDSMAGVCRVLVAENAATDEDIERGLSVLLPLVLPTIKNRVADISGLLKMTEGEDPIATQLMAAAALGTDEVKGLLFKLITEPFVDETIDGGAK